MKKEYVKAVDGISFNVYKKEAFGIVGESGCGKSTTGHAIVGLVRPTSGDIKLHGESILGEKKLLISPEQNVDKTVKNFVHALDR